MRALVALSLDLAIRDPRAAVELERQAIAIARRIGRRDMELLLIGNAGEDSFRTGEWSFQAAEFASLDELEIEASTRLPMEGASTVIALLRGEIDMAGLEARYAGLMDDVQDNDFASNEIDMRAWGAFAEGRFDEAASGWMEMADMSALNAPYVLPRAAGMALLARDAAHARLVLDRMVATGAHGRAIDMDKTAIRAGLAALDGSTQEAIAGFRAAIAGWRDLGLPWDEAMTSLMFVRLVGTGPPEARAAAEAGRSILEGLGARRVLEILDAFVRSQDGWPSTTLPRLPRWPRPTRWRPAPTDARPGQPASAARDSSAADSSMPAPRPCAEMPDIRRVVRGPPNGRFAVRMSRDDPSVSVDPVVPGGAERTSIAEYPCHGYLSQEMEATGQVCAASIGGGSGGIARGPEHGSVSGLGSERLERAASSAASAATAVGCWSAGSATTSARVVTPVSMKTHRAPTARAAARSVAIPSPIMIASPGSRPTAWAAASRRYGAGLPIETGTTPVAASSAMTMRPGARSQAALGRVDRVAVRGDEMGAGADAVRRGGEPRIGQVRVEPDHDGVGVAGGGEAVDRLLAHPGRGGAGRDDVVARVAQLALETAGAEHQHPPDRRVVLAQVERRSRGRTTRPCRARPGRPSRRAASGSRPGSASSCW